MRARSTACFLLSCQDNKDASVWGRQKAAIYADRMLWLRLDLPGRPLGRPLLRCQSSNLRFEQSRALSNAQETKRIEPKEWPARRRVPGGKHRMPDSSSSTADDSPILTSEGLKHSRLPTGRKIRNSTNVLPDPDMRSSARHSLDPPAR